jgi:hypothetical protein
MNRYAIIATRQDEEDCTNEYTTVGNLNSFLWHANWKVIFMRNCKSIFQAYSQAVQELNLKDEDKVILCHDDIEIFAPYGAFNSILDKELEKEDCGFLGVAGSPCLAKKGNWVASARRLNMPTAGFIWHGTNNDNMRFDLFGNAPAQAVAVDGVFMATTGKVLKSIELRRPASFKGGWHWYDAFYCVQAHLKGFKNRVIPLPIRHGSTGNYDQLFYEDMENFATLFKKYLPIVIRDLKE